MNLTSVNNLLQIVVPLASYYLTTDHSFFSNKFLIGFKSVSRFVTVDLEAI